MSRIKTLNVAICKTMRSNKLYQHTLFIWVHYNIYTYNRLKGQIHIYVHIIQTLMDDRVDKDVRPDIKWAQCHKNLAHTHTHSPRLYHHIVLGSDIYAHVPRDIIRGNYRANECVYPYTSQRCKLKSSTQLRKLPSNRVMSSYNHREAEQLQKLQRGR